MAAASRNLNSDIYNYIINDTTKLNENHKHVLPLILHNHAFSSRSLHINPSLKRIIIQRNNKHNKQTTSQQKLRINQISMIVNKRNHNVLKEHSMSNNSITVHHKKVYPSIYKQLQTYRKHTIVHNSNVNCHQQPLPKFNMKVFNYSYGYGSSPYIGFKIKDYNGIKISSSSV